MSVTLDPPRRIAPNTFRVAWTSDLADPTFRVFRNGRKVGKTKDTAWTFSVAPGESPVIEVTDDGSAPARVFPRRVLLTWFGTDPDVDHYRVDKKVSGSWEEKGRVRRRDGVYYDWRSAWLADDTVHEFRVVPVGKNGNDGPALTWSVLMVGYPDPPDVSYDYDAGTGKVTISAA